MDPIRKSVKWGGKIGPCLVGTAACLVSMLLCHGIIAWLVVSERIDESAIGYLTLAVLLVSAMLGSFLAVRRSAEGKLLTSVITGGMYLALLMLLKLVCFPGEWSGVGVTVGAVMGCAVAAALLLSGQGRRSRKKRK